MIILKQINNKIGGAEKETKVLSEFLEFQDVNYKTEYIRNLSGFFNRFRFIIDGLSLLKFVFYKKPLKIYLMLQTAPYGLSEALSLAYPYLVITSLLKAFGITTFYRLPVEGDFKRLTKFLPYCLHQKSKIYCYN